MGKDNQIKKSDDKPPSESACPPAACSAGPVFELVRYNKRRRSRGAEAAEVKVAWPEGHSEYLWMSQQDLRNNISEYGNSPGLLDALVAYRENA